MGSLAHFSPGKTDLERAYYLPHAPDGSEALVDLFIGATLAFGHAGYLVADWMFDPPKMFGLAYCGGGREAFDDGLRLARKSYFMTQAIAARYGMETVEDVRYFDAAGAALGTSEAIRTGAHCRRQIYIRYTGGVHVLVNGNTAERFRAAIGGKTYDLPPRGYRAWTDDGAVVVESGDANGTGPRRDYAKGPDYLFDEPHPSSASY